MTSKLTWIEYLISRILLGSTNSLFIRNKGFALIINISKLSFRVESSELRLCSNATEKAGINAKQRIDDRLEVIATRHAGPVVNIRLIRRCLHRSPIRLRSVKSLGEVRLGVRALHARSREPFHPFIGKVHLPRNE